MDPGDVLPPGPVIAAIEDGADLPGILAQRGLSGPRPVLVSIGGAGGMTDAPLGLMRVLLRDHIFPLLFALGAVVVDGGTDSGVMRVMGRAKHDAAVDVPLIGVAAVGTVRVPGHVSVDDTAEIEPHHTIALVVPGNDWGDESPWISAVAAAIANGAPSATLLVNGGEIAYLDVRHSVDADRPVVVVASTGRTADALAAAVRREDSDPRAIDLARSGLVRAVDVTDGPAVAALLDRLLSR